MGLDGINVAASVWVDDEVIRHRHGTAQREGMANEESLASGRK